MEDLRRFLKEQQEVKVAHAVTLLLLTMAPRA